jgi:hypothetical protein
MLRSASPASLTLAQTRIAECNRILAELANPGDEIPMPPDTALTAYDRRMQATAEKLRGGCVLPDARIDERRRRNAGQPHRNSTAVATCIQLAS